MHDFTSGMISLLYGAVSFHILPHESHVRKSCIRTLTALCVARLAGRVIRCSGQLRNAASIGRRPLSCCSLSKSFTLQIKDEAVSRSLVIHDHRMLNDQESEDLTSSSVLFDCLS
ncbi:unnamed protein product [Soboliphyme baturini]|uniref:Secreted protein n=1 Tax=Soboliphyme baturini TaxID=241478 RepID=A0A183IUQ6_9BILA|nr:unnamed protein product [Soboliphyme baturini]